MELFYQTKTDIVYLIHHKICFYNYEYLFHSQVNPEELPILQIVKLTYNMSIMKLLLLY